MTNSLTYVLVRALLLNSMSLPKILSLSTQYIMRLHKNTANRGSLQQVSRFGRCGAIVCAAFSAGDMSRSTENMLESTACC